MISLRRDIMNPLVIRYLKHLGMPLKNPSIEYLCALQKAHIETIPHENIEGIFNIHTTLEIPHLINKYICENRGGLCFELNYTFAWLLNELGFQVEIILADVLAYEKHKENNDYPTHPIIIVTIQDQHYLTDAGWSDSYRNPISLAADEYNDTTGKYRVISANDEKCLMQKFLENEENPGQFSWHDQFIFAKPKPYPILFALPEGFYAAHAYTHVGKNHEGKKYLFTNTFHYAKIKPEGHKTIWNDDLLTREGTQRESKSCESIPVTLQKEFQVPSHIANQCVKSTRRHSAFFSQPSLNQEEAIENIDAYFRMRGNSI